MAVMAEISRPELCIVGAGALGIALAQHARALGARVVLADRGFAEPGDGPQRALRVAALKASASAAAAMSNAAALGLASGEPRVSMKAVQERARQVAADSAALDSPERLTALGIEVIAGPTRFVDAATLMVGDAQIRPQAFLLAPGGDAAVPAIPGLEEAGYFTPDSILDNTRKLTHLLVIGADPEGLALAQAFSRLGSAVTLVPQGEALAGFDIETASLLIQALTQDGVTVLDGATVRTVQPRSQGIGAVVDLADGGTAALDLSHILICGGHLARLEGLALDAARLRPVRGQAGRLAIGALGQTSNRRVRVTGVAAGIADWPQAMAHGRAVVEALVLGTARRGHRVLPQLVMTEPALAQIGRFPADARKIAPGYGLYRANLFENDMARALGQAQGLVKVLADARGRPVAASAVGAGAAELAGVLALAMEQGVTIDALASLPLPRPSLMSSLVALGENRMAGRTVSSWARRRGAILRMLRR